MSPAAAPFAVDPILVAAITAAVVVALQLPWLQRALPAYLTPGKSTSVSPPTSSRPALVATSDRNTFDESAPPPHGTLFALSLRESMFVAGAMVNGSYTLSLNMTLHHADPSPLSPSNVHAALVQLQARHAFLRAKVVQHDSVDTPFVLQIDQALRIPLIELPADASMSEQWAKHRGTPLACGEPLLRVLWQAQSATTRVVFLVHHAIADGRSLSCLAHDFLSVLTTMCGGSVTTPLPPLSLVPSCDDVAKRAARSRPLRSLQSFGHTILSGIRGRHAFAFPIDAAATNTFLALRDNAPLGLTSHFDATTTAQLVAACKAHRVSVTAALGAALMHAVADIAPTSSPDNKISLGTVADARNLGSVNHPIAPEVLALFATALPVFSHTIQRNGVSSELSVPQSHWTTAAAYGQHLQECTARQDGLVVGVLMGLNMKQMMKAPKLTLGRPTIILSNSGVLPKLQTQYGGVVAVSHVHVTSNQLYSFPKVSASTMGGVLTLNFDGVAPIIKGDDLAMLQARTAWHLHAMVATAE